MHAFLDRLGRGAARHHWFVIGGWVVLVAGLFVLRSAFGGTYVNDYTVPGSESSAGLSVLNKDFSNQGGYSGSIVFHAKSGKVSDQADAVKTSMAAVAELPDVVAATDPLATSQTAYISKDGAIVNAPVSFSVVPASLDATYLDSLDAAVQPARAAGLEVEYGGGAGQIGKQADDALSEAIGLGLALLLLFLMFRSIVAAGLPLVSAVFSVGGGLAILGLLAAVKDFPVSAPTVATLLGLGVAIDYGLFLVSRHREQLDDGMTVEESVGRAESTSGAAVLVAGGTVVIAILGLYVSGVPFVGALGLSSAIVVAVTVLAALTLIPAMLGLAKLLVLNRADRHHLTAERSLEADLPDEAAIAEHRAEERERRDAKHEQSAFARWGRRVSDKPWPYGIVATLVLLVLAIPLLSMNLGQLDAGTDPTSDSSRKAYDLVAEGFGPGANGPLTVVVTLPSESSADKQTLLTNLASTLQKQAGVAAVQPPSTNSAGTTAIINVIPTTSPSSADTEDLVNRIRDDVLAGQQEKTYVVGTTAGYVDFTEKVAGRMLWLIGAVVLLAFLLLTVAFRSILIGVKAAILNLLSVGAAYGVIVAVFQWGWGSSLVGIEENVPIPSFVPMLMFAIVFGLSMDYEVFLLSRVHEAWIATNDSHRAVAIGIGATARVITTAAAIMVVVFLSFVLDDDPTVKMLAVGMAVAVLIDASIVRMVLVPSVMTLLGDKAWWLPRWLDRIIPDIQLEGGPTPQPPARETPSPERVS
ncbi:RND superfamily putative drug exporter [Kribbella orskensis]|uniref:RND superfamily putative drug exporter n=1 Tax=Kribbella orskensis TaxID=2512216 RepID=A0ABY2B9D2_9ACTN|nr:MULTISPECIES: MMPL family transporter [Kribbella]TCN32310.1 RND superfamily putative drug exporter [Kribbella sp. VKM Ac-2500]TCO12595.1 RND superfamily putative drug exporter [Kribbella orskensis]